MKMTGNKNLTVNFATKSSGGSSSKYNLTIKNTGSVSGTVKLLDVDNNVYLNDLSNNFSCTAGINGGKCEFSVESGRKVKVLSYAGPVGYSADWSSANCSSSGVESSGWGYCKITMSGSNKEIEIKITKSGLKLNSLNLQVLVQLIKDRPQKLKTPLKRGFLICYPHLCHWLYLLKCFKIRGVLSN